jgi:hypothetical protein
MQPVETEKLYAAAQLSLGAFLGPSSFLFYRSCKRKIGCDEPAAEISVVLSKSLIHHDRYLLVKILSHRQMLRGIQWHPP